jgi:SAM-dependent methyltransferase
MKTGDLRLHLGCGRSKRDGFVGVDIMPLKGVDVVHDLSAFPYPFEDNSVSEIIMRNVLEHLTDTVRVMEEVWRISKNGARINILVPYFNSPGAAQDPTHVRFFTENSFDYFTPDGETALSAYNFYSKARFRITSLHAHQAELLALLPKRVQWLLAHHLATVHTLDFNLIAVK